MLPAPRGAEPVLSGARSQLVCFPFRIVAARLNGSLDFFSLETHAAFSPLQFRGQWPGLGVWVRAACKRLTLSWPVVSRAGQFPRGPCVQQ